MTDSGSDKVQDKTTTTAKSSENLKSSTLNKKLPKFEEPGLKTVKTTSIFRAVNFELYVKPVGTKITF